MDVIRAKTAGFCMGVGLALQKLDTALEQPCEGRTCTLGPIIHNPQVLADYEALGVFCAQDPSQLNATDRVLIRAHGITRQVEEAVRATGADVVDATCPKVKRAQLAIERATRDGEELLLFGEADHPEVRGLVSYAHGPAHVFGSRDELAALHVDPERSYVLASQTTQDRSVFEQLEKELRDRLPRLKVLATICDATRERQEEARSIAAQVDAMVVVGGRQSGNTRRLADLAGPERHQHLSYRTGRRTAGRRLCRQGARGPHRRGFHAPQAHRRHPAMAGAVAGLTGLPRGTAVCPPDRAAL